MVFVWFAGKPILQSFGMSLARRVYGRPRHWGVSPSCKNKTDTIFKLINSKNKEKTTFQQNIQAIR